MKPLRDRDPDSYRHITIRTHDGKFYLRPNRTVRRIIGGIIARYQEMLDIEIYAYAFLSNHYHLIIRAPHSNVDAFTGHLNREIARRMNYLNKRTGSIWPRPYTDQKILSEEDLLEAFLYITTNPTRHGLVSDTRDWTGLHCFEHALKERDRIFNFYHYSESDPARRTTTHRLKLTILPHFAHLPHKVRAKKIRALLEDRMASIRESRLKAGKGFLGIERIRLQHAEDVPHDMAKSPRPPCYTKCHILRAAFKAESKFVRTQYSEASFKYRLGDPAVEFPPYTFRPPTHQNARLLPFKPIESIALEKA